MNDSPRFGGDSSAQSLTVTPINPGYAAVATGVDLARPLPPDLRQAIVRALDEYAVLVFHDQPLSPAELVTLGEQFGPLDRGLQQKLMKKMQDRLQDDAITDVSNVDAAGATAQPGHVQAEMTVGNRFWHTDASYDTHPFRYSMLSAVTAVSRRGETEFADLRLAYDRLDADTRALIADKEAVFWSHNTRQKLGIVDPPSSLAAYPPVRWPMVRTHAGSGRKVLWCDSKVCEVIGMSIPEGRALVHDLIEHIGQREHVYAHSWRPGDLVIYDNRAVLHRGRAFDVRERREMRRVATVDDSTPLGVVRPRAPVVLQPLDASFDRADPASFAQGQGGSEDI